MFNHIETDVPFGASLHTIEYTAEGKEAILYLYKTRQ